MNPALLLLGLEEGGRQAEAKLFPWFQEEVERLVLGSRGRRASSQQEQAACPGLG